MTDISVFQDKVEPDLWRVEDTDYNDDGACTHCVRGAGRGEAGAGTRGMAGIEATTAERMRSPMEIFIELREEELLAVSGGAGSASFTFTNTASGTPATVTGTLTQSTTASSARQSGTFTSSSGYS